MWGGRFRLSFHDFAVPWWGFLQGGIEFFPGLAAVAETLRSPLVICE
jgi:hypothetical protein